jgi:predicted transcriptional regulator/transcriptional regulator with XRE-family HTH domain
MSVQKVLVGPRLRQLRRDHQQTQIEMAKALGLSAAYVNLLENNQRSLSAHVLMRISEVYGVDWRALMEDDSVALMSDLRQVVQDPIFGADAPDRQELRSALDHCPRLARNFLQLHKSYRGLTERLLAGGESGAAGAEAFLRATPESVVHDLFRRHDNYFGALEEAARDFRAGEVIPPDEVYSYLKRRLRADFGIVVELVSARGLPGTLRLYDQKARKILLSQGLDYPNKVFQLTHVAGLIRYRALIDSLIEGNGLAGETRDLARCRVELANYFAAAVLMPYEDVLAAALESGYDIDYLAARFGVSFEQACQRVTTLQRDGAKGVPFFFLRVDRAGNVTKRFNATPIHLAEYGGGCPRWDVHQCFRMPGRTLPQFVEMPDGSRYFTISRTVDRPALGHESQDHRLAITLGCSIEFAPRIVYAAQFQMNQPGIVTPIGINCRVCPRHNCSQRAHQPVVLDLPIDEARRGQTRFES